MKEWLTRRRLIGGMVGVLFGTRRATSVNASDVSTMNYCYWRNEQFSYCRYGRRNAKWCFICNDPGTGWESVGCEWRDAGPC